MELVGATHQSIDEYLIEFESARSAGLASVTARLAKSGKRLSKGRFRWWPEADKPAKRLEAYEAQLMLAAGDVSRVRAAPMWKRVDGPN